MEPQQNASTDDTNALTPSDVTVGETVSLRYKSKPTRTVPQIKRYTTTVTAVKGVFVHLEHVYDMEGFLILDTEDKELYHREDGWSDTFMGDFAWLVE